MQFSEIDDSEYSDEEREQLIAIRAAVASRSTWTSVGVNLVLTAVQMVVGVYAKSQALLAGGVHSLSDLVADFVVLFANRESRKAANKSHPYGHYRFENATSLVLGGLLLAVGLGMLWSAFRKLESPETVRQVHVVALIVGFMVGRMGWEFGGDTLHDLMDRSADDGEVRRATESPAT
ncbi:MAG: cation diffusion facilitator family transporter [Propionivibrio sp.]